MILPRTKEKTNEQNEINNGNNINYPLNSSNTENNNTVTPNTIKKLKEIVNEADILEIEIINSLTMPRGIKININSLGMIENSKRKAYDGITYFGFLGDDNTIDNNNNNDIDFEIKPKENNIENKNLGRYFRIRYDLITSGYLIKDLGCGFGTFKKITEKTKLKDSYLINIGNSYIVCVFGVDEYNINDDIGLVDADKILNIKVFSEIQKPDPYFFNPQQYKKIYIGRDISCNIIIEDTILSRIHCTIEYQEGAGEGWYIYDGKIDEQIEEEKHSTNGTWLYLTEETIIKEGMIFKSNQNQYKCHIIKQKKRKS